MRKTIVLIVIMVQCFFVMSQTYNPEKAARYAQRWCNGRNTNAADATEWGGPYIDYSLYYNGGKDCAAFVSQCLIFGGLDLRAGTDGHGAYVKTDNVIAGAAQLVQHLDSFQTCTKTMVDQGTYYLDADLGDPCFLLNAYGNLTTAYHSYICSQLDENAMALFSAHTNDVCNTVPRSDYRRSLGIVMKKFLEKSFNTKNSVFLRLEKSPGGGIGRRAGLKNR